MQHGAMQNNTSASVKPRIVLQSPGHTPVLHTKLIDVFSCIGLDLVSNVYHRSGMISHTISDHCLAPEGLPLSSLLPVYPLRAPCLSLSLPLPLNVEGTFIAKAATDVGMWTNVPHQLTAASLDMSLSDLPCPAAHIAPGCCRSLPRKLNLRLFDRRGGMGSSPKTTCNQ